MFIFLFSELFGLELTTISSEAFKDVTVNWDLYVFTFHSFLTDSRISWYTLSSDHRMIVVKYKPD